MTCSADSKAQHPLPRPALGGAGYPAGLLKVAESGPDAGFGKRGRRQARRP